LTAKLLQWSKVSFSDIISIQIPREQVRSTDIITPPERLEMLGYAEVPSTDVVVEREAEIYTDPVTGSRVTDEGLLIKPVTEEQLEEDKPDYETFKKESPRTHPGQSFRGSIHQRKD